MIASNNDFSQNPRRNRHEDALDFHRCGVDDKRHVAGTSSAWSESDPNRVTAFIFLGDSRLPVLSAFIVNTPFRRLEVGWTDESF